MYAIAEVGTRIVVGGTFTTVNPPGDTSAAGAVARKFLLAFDSTTGAVDPGFVPVLNNGVESLKPGPTPDTVYVGGHFTTVNGAAGRGVTLLSTVTGKKVAGFTSPTMNGDVFTIGRSGNHLLLGGTFTTLGGASHDGIGSVNAATGAVETYITVQLTGHHNFKGTTGANGGVGPRMLDVSPDGTQAVVIGNFKLANGVTHDQIARLNLGASSGTLNTAWNTSGYTAACASGAFDTYMRDVAFAPDGSYFVIAATGGGTTTKNTDGTRALCDAATRWNTAGSGTNVQPAWIDYTGNDSFLSVATTGTAVYVGGHQRWVNNGNASDKPGAGAVPRPGVVALDPVNGMPFAWNPGRNPRGSGAWALLATANGLYMGSDTDKIGTGATYTTRGRIALFPLVGGESVPGYAPPNLPASVYLAGQLPTGAANVLYRVNAGGPTIPAVDNGPDWAGDAATAFTYRNSGSTVSTWPTIPTVNPAVPASTPNGVFGSERHDPGAKGDTGEMLWTFPVPAGTNIEVRLYFANQNTATATAGKRKFDVTLDGTKVLANYDIVADTGNLTGTVKKFDVAAPATGKVTVAFGHEVSDPLVNGIEIVNRDAAAPVAGQLDTLRSRTFTGTTSGTTAAVAPGSILWSQVRGAFVAGGTLFYGYTDGQLHRAPISGTAIGASTVVDPYDDPFWSNVDTGSGQTYRGGQPTMYGIETQTVTGMVYSAGRLYFSLAGQAGLRYRAFEPDDGVLGDEFAAGGTVDFSNVAGMFLAGSTLYYADKATGNLRAVAWNAGAPNAATSTVVSGPAVDGNDWRARALFTLPVPPPTAAFTSSCTDLGCAFDAGPSAAPGAAITAYAWTFDDGATGTGATPAHAYAAAGTYTVTLTVTSSLGATASVSHVIQPYVTVPSAISFVDSAGAAGNAATMTVTVPPTVLAGDGLLLFASAANQTAITTPAGWTLLGTSPPSTTSITTQVYARVATDTDAGTPVSVDIAGTPHSTLQLVAYRGTDATNFVVSAAVGTAAGGTSIATPTQPVATADEWVVSYFAAKSSAVTGWTLGQAQTTRGVADGTGSGRVDSIVADSAGNVAPGTGGGVNGTTDQAFAGATGWTIVLTP